MGHTTTTTFTVNGQKASVEDNLGNTTAYAYGHGGELLTTTDALSHTVSDQYDSRYRLIQTTDANSGVTSITLDGVGNRTALVDGVGNATDWTYNAINLPLTETNSLGTTTTGYNADGLFPVESTIPADYPQHRSIMRSTGKSLHGGGDALGSSFRLSVIARRGQPQSWRNKTSINLTRRTSDILRGPVPPYGSRPYCTLLV